jgi:hypothetical protein
MKIYNDTLKTYLKIFLSLYRNYCFRQSGKDNEFTKEVGDMVKLSYENGYLLSYALGIAEVCKSTVFTQEKINELKKLPEDKMRKEAQKIQSILSSSSHKIIKDSIAAYKEKGKFFDYQLERHNLIMDGFFYITSESKDFLKLSEKYKDMNIKKITTNFTKQLNKMISGYEKRFKKSKNPYDQFVQPYEEPYVKIYLSKELKDIYLFCTPNVVKGYAHGVADMSNIFEKNKFYLLTTFQNKNISFSEKSISQDLLNYQKELIKYKFI